jgi:hypothetical protein
MVRRALYNIIINDDDDDDNDARSLVMDESFLHKLKYLNRILLDFNTLYERATKQKIAK